MKQLISFFLKKVPRKYLQLFSHFALKIVAVFYRGNKVECPVCEHHFSKFVPYGRVARANALCPNCLALERHRLMWLYLKEKTDFFQSDKDILHIAPEICFIKRFEAIHGDRYITADLESPLAKVKMDIHHMPFEDASFDVTFCNHVMEHVADDIQSMKEIHRVLRPGGWAIIQIPFFPPVAETTYEDDSITNPKEREKIFGQDDHVRLYGKDYPERLRTAGFEVVEDDFVQTLSPEQQNRYALPKDEVIYLCRKNN
ncbi:class I SAM-dependent methyltransferase [Reichenbachiella ulvae]|uniref:Methyltransferase domain-containing protein n=1 Tax=Reichenbachiella ulvae TaxID=2980104 RepID=A0ABT3CVK1_9BACT|nr:class I SAM-dependent methyltransferase [Reichenbachiella ulvae]MCV9387564.1 methyltransferase domain-containing protein [Reichenbachiella ulvae]